MVEKKHRIEDALEAVRSAQVDGVVPGGVATLLRISRSLLESEALSEFESFGIREGTVILAEAIREPFKRIVSNAGFESDEIIDKLTLEVLEENKGYDAVSEKVVNMYDAGIIDPAKVTKSAVTNAASAAGTLLTTNCGIFEK